MTNASLSERYIKTGFVWLLSGMVFGIWMGITESFHFSNAHAHTNLVGFLLSLTFGFTLKHFPDLAGHPQAKLQFWLFQAGAIILVLGKIFVALDTSNNAPVAVGSMLTLLGTALFVWMLFRLKSQ
ncbi:hypothetical protein O4H49_13295 [Kiloniella laminariae]|uniref:TonB-dependent receptor n=1 Tax=Kiloniella laminariae TaxID=454162 RepID=A0ABT4LLD7_9PROT|nr:hypothetical protein [Kiloniella laminariae]MCZ4281760.1 hypothetical protein [Kiloniella laminariae]